MAFSGLKLFRTHSNYDIRAREWGGGEKPHKTRVMRTQRPLKEKLVKIFVQNNEFRPPFSAVDFMRRYFYKSDQKPPRRWGRPFSLRFFKKEVTISFFFFFITLRCRLVCF